MVSPPLLSKPTQGEIIYLYLTVSESVASGALIREEEGIQKPVYYVNHAMNGPQTKYQKLEKLVLALFIISRKLMHYFQTFPITVLTEHPLRTIVENSKATGRISKWASELMSYGLKYKPRTSDKGQLLADFISRTIEYDDQLEGWVLSIGGASNNKGAEIRIVLTTGGINH